MINGRRGLKSLQRAYDRGAVLSNSSDKEFSLPIETIVHVQRNGAEIVLAIPEATEWLIQHAHAPKAKARDKS
jgi:hypothetical protein